jgi:para-nitrobenzyl esterase
MRFIRSIKLANYVAISAVVLGACDGRTEDGVSSVEQLITVSGADAGSDGAHPSHRRSGLRVQLEDGVVEGDVVGGARRFLKIPYAQPPVGDLRWKAPRKNRSWAGIRHETEFAPPCAQKEIAGWTPASDTEDCLYLNIWTPRPAPKNAPVMIWIHGGGNYAGAASDKMIGKGPGAGSLWYDGQFLAANHGVVVVSFNYRLGPMGFFAHEELADEGSPNGNQGMLDQRAVLLWVQRNIRQFGGNPHNVTIFGESAGSHDVCYHIASPLSRGLFHRAISESGGCTVSLLGGKELTSAEDAALHAGFIKALGCDSAADQLACMRAKSVAEVLAAAGELNPGRKPTTQPWTFGVVVDGPDGFLPDQPRAIYDSQRIARVPYIIGSNSEEGTIFMVGAPAITSESDYQKRLKLRYGAKADAVAAVYPAAKFGGDYRAAMARAIGDEVLGCSTYDTALRAARAGLDVHMYNFNVPWNTGTAWLGAAHASEIQYVFGNLTDPTPENKKVSDVMGEFWTSFAAFGHPYYRGEPTRWPAFIPDGRKPEKRIQFGPGFEILDDFRKDECTYWFRQYDENFKQL